MRVLVTGGTGFIGRHLVAALSRAGHEVFCLVRQTSRREVLAPYQVQLVFGDLTDRASLQNIPEGIDTLFHCAAYVSNKDKKALYRSNVAGTGNICSFARERKIGRLVYMSSVSVISGNETLPLSDRMPYRAMNPYGESKIEAEKIVLEYRRQGGAVVVLRPCMIYGEDEPHLLHAILRLLKYRLLPLFDGGRTAFHMGYVENVVDLALFSLTDERFLEGTFIIADKEVLTMGETMRLMAEAINAPEPLSLPGPVVSFLKKAPLLGPKLSRLLHDREYNTERATSLGFRHRFPAAESIQRSCRVLMKKWIRENS